MLTRLGEVFAFTMMRFARHSSVTVSQRSVQPSPESLERAYQQLEALHGKRREASPLCLLPAILTAPEVRQEQPVSYVVYYQYARVAELVDARDLKSLGR